MSRRLDIPPAQRSRLLIANRHACCVCGQGGVQIHHINSDPSDNADDNLAILCLEHHDKATAPQSFTARLRPEEIIVYKRHWQEQCASYASQVARGRTAFFMVDYKNAERLRQLFGSLSGSETAAAADALRRELREESMLRKEQGFDRSLEVTMDWDPRIEPFIEEIQKGTVHPAAFSNAESHPSDPLFPAPNKFQREFFLYDLWCQLMTRAIIAVRRTYDINDLMLLDDPRSASLNGSLLSFEGNLKGNVYPPAKWATHPIGKTTVTVTSTAVGGSRWIAALNLKTHYVYSDTGAMSLENGTANGVLLLRSIDRVELLPSGEKVVRFSATPLIIGSGVLRIGDMRADA
jgi:hypothetical protein